MIKTDINLILVDDLIIRITITDKSIVCYFQYFISTNLYINRAVMNFKIYPWDLFG